MRRAAVLTAVCALPVLLVAPAHADGELGLSYDGTTWHESLSRPLFDPDVRWVPGDVRTARFFVRNQSDDAGTMTLDVARVRRTALVDSGYLRISARSGHDPWTSLEDGDVSTLIDDVLVSAGRPVPVEVRVAMGSQAPNGTMVLATDLDFRVALRDAEVVSGVSENADGTDGTDGTGGTGGTLLPDTGAPFPPWLPVLGFGLLGAGTWLVVRRRRDDETTTDPVA